MLPEDNILTPNNYLNHFVVCIYDVCGIDIFIVENIPNICNGSRGLIIGCAVYFGPIKIIYLKSGFIQEKDQFGFTTFEHEALHIICECDFHVNEGMKTAVSKQLHPFEWVIKYKTIIRSGKSFDGI